MRKFYLIIAWINLIGLLAWGQRSELNFDRDWRFARFGLQADGSRVEEPDSLQSYSYNDWDWRRLDVPHDWGIEGPFRIDLDGYTGKLPWKVEVWNSYLH